MRRSKCTRRAQAALENGSEYGGGAAAVMQMSALGWTREWVRWLTFIGDAAVRGGGFRIG
jgi:hypothetical protein